MTPIGMMINLSINSDLAKKIKRVSYQSDFSALSTILGQFSGPSVVYNNNRQSNLTQHKDVYLMEFGHFLP